MFSAGIKREYFSDNTQKMKFFIKDFFSKFDKIRRKQRIWPHLLKKSLMENFIFCAMRKGLSGRYFSNSPYKSAWCIIWRINPAVNFMFKVNNRNAKTRCEICSKLIIKTPKCCSIVHFEHNLHFDLVFLLLTLSR